MPSPVGHTLAALAAGWAVAPPAAPGRTLIIQGAALAAVGLAPDLDLLVGRHNAETHSIGAAVLAASLAALVRWPVAERRWQIWLAVFLVWLTHPLLDALGQDTAAPIGVMAYWPFSTEHYSASVALFRPVWRRWWSPGFVEHNLLTVFREVVILLPITAGVWWLRSRARARRPARSPAPRATRTPADRS